jgi:hypothetical protein
MLAGRDDFRAPATLDLMTAARTFVETLQPNDPLALNQFPRDADDLTTDRRQIIATREGGEAYLTQRMAGLPLPSDIIDFLAQRLASHSAIRKQSVDRPQSSRGRSHKQEHCEPLALPRSSR